MNSSAEKLIVAYPQFEQLREARAILHAEGAALYQLAGSLDMRFCEAVDRILDCTGSVVVCGMGKAGLIGQKIAATMSSTGSSARFLHPAEAVHGDLGSLKPDDLLLVLSNSGETEEVCRLLPCFRQMKLLIIAITGSESSTLGQSADIVLTLGRLPEADHLGLAPSTSTTAMLALGDALALVVSQLRQFTPQQFGIYHPGGSLGAKLKRVEEAMRCGVELRISPETCSVREAFVKLSKPGRRSGAVILVNATGELSGLFTDSDLAKLLEHHRESQLDRPIAEVMTRNPFTIRPAALLTEAVELLSRYKLSELPVVDESHRPVGLLDITDLIGLMPVEEN